MKVIRGMLGSKKWTSAIGTIIGLAVADTFGVELSSEVLASIVAILIGVIGAEGIADAAGARQSRLSAE